MGIRSAAAFAALAALLGTAPSAARAASLSADRPCYLAGESVILTGSGFAPGEWVVVSDDGGELGAIVADGDGGISVRLTAPRVVGIERAWFVASSRRQPSLRASARLRFASTDVLLEPRPDIRRHRPRIRAWGFIDVGTVYAHVKRGRRARTIRLGRPRGPCGVLDVRRRLWPAQAWPGLYTIQFDALRRYVPSIQPSVGYVVALGPLTASSSKE